MNCCQSAHEIGRGAVGVAQSFANEDRSLEVEEVDAGEDVGEADVHDEEEENSLVVLDDFADGGTLLVVEDDADDAEE